jgi:phosphatidylserine/phosphatidylglycerophosphate/cardiolipin synthase-like enzyme
VFHPKVLVVDSVVSFVGSPNSTNASLVNGEVSVKITDAAVAAQVYEQAWKEAQRVESY